jgi:membrane-associated phospholipid phosphatase
MVPSGVNLFFRAVNTAFYPVTGVLLLFRANRAWKGFIVLIIAVLSIKTLVRRKRPDGSDRLSFPSGHAATTWFLVPVYDNNPLVALWASVVSASRVILGRHYITDVVAGGLIGFVFGTMIK